MNITIGQKVPNLEVSEWVQGMPTNFDQENDNVVLVDVFQINCPGCFMHAIPEAINIYNKYKNNGVRVLGIATAFEDFDKNTLSNLKMLVNTGEVVGETKRMLSTHNYLKDGNKLPYKIPFPIGMDNLTGVEKEVSQERIMQFIYSQIPEFDSHSVDYRNQIMQKSREHLESKKYTAKTFEKFSLRGTPSTILVDRNGILKDISFGKSDHLDALVQKLLNEN